ncbi:MAG: helix-turn-helix domain-containing protein [Actinobacteria bacterium]|nr:helix-turn-helix domain-containing protein [Actinomycetota bacterium]
MYVAGQDDGATTTDAAAAAALPVPTAHHLLSTLTEEGLLARGEGRRFVLGPGVAALAAAYTQAEAVPGWLLEPLRRLVREQQETAYLSAWRGDEIRVLASLESGAAVRVAGAERGPYPSPHGRATGKLLLALADPQQRAAVLGEGRLEAATAKTIVDREALAAEFEQIRKRGWAVDAEEYIEGVCCISAPAIVNDVVVAAYTVSVPAHHFDRRRAVLLGAVEGAATEATHAHVQHSEETPDDQH